MKLNIPEELQGSFNRLVHRVPEKLKNDIHTQKMILLYLKLAGERLASQHIEVAKMRCREEAHKNTLETQTIESSTADETQGSDPDSSEDGSLNSMSNSLSQKVPLQILS